MKLEELKERVERHTYNSKENWVQAVKKINGVELYKTDDNNFIYAIKQFNRPKTVGYWDDKKKGVVYSGTEGLSILDSTMKKLKKITTEELTERYREGGCMYCKQDATTGYVWADGRAIIKVCDNHKDKAKHQIEVVNKDKIEKVTKL